MLETDTQTDKVPQSDMGVLGPVADEWKKVLPHLTKQQYDFCMWYFDPDKVGTQAQWARKHNVHPTTLSIWKGQDWFIALSKRWDVVYDTRFSEVVRTLYQKATDRDDMQQVQAARTLAELLGKFAPKKSEVHVTLEHFLGGASAIDPRDEIIEASHRILSERPSGSTLVASLSSESSIVSEEVSEDLSSSEPESIESV